MRDQPVPAAAGQRTTIPARPSAADIASAVTEPPTSSNRSRSGPSRPRRSGPAEPPPTTPTVNTPPTTRTPALTWEAPSPSTTRTTSLSTSRSRSRSTSASRAGSIVSSARAPTASASVRTRATSVCGSAALSTGQIEQGEGLPQPAVGADRQLVEPRRRVAELETCLLQQPEIRRQVAVQLVEHALPSVLRLDQDHLDHAANGEVLVPGQRYVRERQQADHDHRGALPGRPGRRQRDRHRRDEAERTGRGPQQPGDQPGAGSARYQRGSKQARVATTVSSTTAAAIARNRELAGKETVPHAATAITSRALARSHRCPGSNAGGNRAMRRHPVAGLPTNRPGSRSGSDRWPRPAGRAGSEPAAPAGR